jgi:hypothetical protein
MALLGGKGKQMKKKMKMNIRRREERKVEVNVKADGSKIQVLSCARPCNKGRKKNV